MRVIQNPMWQDNSGPVMTMRYVLSCVCDGARAAGCPEMTRSCGRSVVLGVVAKSCCCCEAGMVGAGGESSRRRSKGANVDERGLGRSDKDFRLVSTV